MLCINLGCRRSRFIYLFNLAVVFSSPDVFPFPPRTDKLLGDFHVNRRCASNCLVHLGRRWRCRGDDEGEGEGDGEEEGDSERDEGRRRYLKADGDKEIKNVL